MMTRLFATICVVLCLAGCVEDTSKMNAEEKAAHEQAKLKENLDIPSAATDVVELPTNGYGRWATFRMEVQGKSRNFLYHRAYGDAGVESLTELSGIAPLPQ